jgi:hypothetical protein
MTERRQGKIKRIGEHELLASNSEETVFIPLDVCANQPRKYRLIEYYISKDQDGKNRVTYAKCFRIGKPDD